MTSMRERVTSAGGSARDRVASAGDAARVKISSAGDAFSAWGRRQKERMGERKERLLPRSGDKYRVQEEDSDASLTHGGSCAAGLVCAFHASSISSFLCALCSGHNVLRYMKSCQCFE